MGLIVPGITIARAPHTCAEGMPAPKLEPIHELLILGNPLSKDGTPMTTADRKNEYLVKAKDAEVRAEKSKDESDKAEWLRIAAGYHALAAHQDQSKG